MTIIFTDNFACFILKTHFRTLKMKGKDFWIRLCRLIFLQILFSFSDMFSDLSTGRLGGNSPNIARIAVK